MKEFNLRILTNSRKVYEGKVKKLTTTDSQGEMGIYANHSNYVTALVPCKTVFEGQNGKVNELFTSTGIMSISKDVVTLLCDSAEFKDEIDKSRAEESKKRAEKRLKDRSKDVDLKRAEISLKRSLARLSI